MLLRGNGVVLSKVRQEHWPLFMGWMQDEEIIRNVTDDVGRFRSPEDVAQFFIDNYKYPYGRLMVIEVKPKGKELTPVGYVSASGFDFKNRKCTMGCVLGDKSAVEAGLDAEAIQVFCRYLNKELGIHRVDIVIPSDDKAGNDMYQRAGFKREGVLRCFYFYGGCYHDVHIMSWMGE